MLTTLLISSLVLPAALAANVGHNFVKYDIKAKRACSGLSKVSGKLGKLHARQIGSELTKQQDGTSYTIQLGLGSPSQPVEVQLDTGSTDLWVNPNCANAGSDVSINFCNSLPRFDSKKSTSFVDLGQSYDLIYGGGNATIEWVTDDVTIGSTELQAQRLGVATNSHLEPFGILGVGPQTFDSQPKYTYFIDALVAQGFTQSRAFGLDIRSIDAADGSIVFGGLDRGKYAGSLEKLPIIPASSSPNGNRYWVSLGAIDLVKDGAKTSVSTAPIPVLLDSGSTLMRLPQDAYFNLGENFPTAVIDAGGSGFYIVDCAVASQKGSVNFKFGSKTIKVQYKDVIWTVSKSDNLCVLGAQGIPPQEQPQLPILGDSFLRAAYAVFDQDNNNIHLAQAGNCGSEVVAIGKGANAVPSLAGLCPEEPEDTTSSTSSTSSTYSATSTSSTYTPTGFPNGTYTPPHTTKYPTSTKKGDQPPYPTTTPYPTYDPNYPTYTPYPTNTGKGKPTYTWTYYSTSCYTKDDYLTTETYTSYSTYCPTGTEGPYPTGYPEYPEGDKPSYPEYPEGDKPEHPEYPEGEKPEYPEGNKPEHPEYPEGDKPEKPEYPEGEKPEYPEGDKPDYPEGGKKPEDEKPYPTGGKDYPKTTLGTAVAIPVTTSTYKPVVTAGVGRTAASAGLALAVAAVAALL